MDFTADFKERGPWRQAGGGTGRPIVREFAGARRLAPGLRYPSIVAAAGLARAKEPASERGGPPNDEDRRGPENGIDRDRRQNEPPRRPAHAVAGRALLLASKARVVLPGRSAVATAREPREDGLFRRRPENHRCGFPCYLERTVWPPNCSIRRSQTWSCDMPRWRPRDRAGGLPGPRVRAAQQAISRAYTKS